MKQVWTKWCLKRLQQQDGLYANCQNCSQGDFINVLKLTEERMEKHEIAKWDMVASHECNLKISKICCHHNTGISMI